MRIFSALIFLGLLACVPDPLLSVGAGQVLQRLQAERLPRQVSVPEDGSEPIDIPPYAYPWSAPALERYLQNYRLCLTQDAWNPELPFSITAGTPGPQASAFLFPSRPLGAFLQELFPSRDGALRANTAASSLFVKLEMKAWGELALLKWTKEDPSILYQYFRSHRLKRAAKDLSQIQDIRAVALRAGHLDALRCVWDRFYELRNQNAREVFDEEGIPLTFYDFVKLYVFNGQEDPFLLDINFFDSFFQEQDAYRSEEGKKKGLIERLQEEEVWKTSESIGALMEAGETNLKSMRAQEEFYKEVQTKLSQKISRSKEAKFQEANRQIIKLLKGLREANNRLLETWVVADLAPSLRLWRFADLMIKAYQEDPKIVQMALWGYIYCQGQWTPERGFSRLEEAYEGYFGKRPSFVEDVTRLAPYEGKELFRKLKEREVPVDLESFSIALESMSSGPWKRAEQGTASVIHPETRERESFTDCFETSFRDVLNGLSHKEEGMEIDIWPEGSPLRKFYEGLEGMNPGLAEVRNPFAQMICGIEGVDYVRPREHPWCEIRLGIRSLVRTLTYLLGCFSTREDWIAKFEEQEDKNAAAQSVLTELLKAYAPRALDKLEALKVQKLKYDEGIGDYFGEILLHFNSGYHFTWGIEPGHGKFEEDGEPGGGRSLREMNLHDLWKQLPESEGKTLLAPLAPSWFNLKNESPSRDRMFWMGIDADDLYHRDHIVDWFLRFGSDEDQGLAHGFIRRSAMTQDRFTGGSVAHLLWRGLEEGGLAQDRALKACQAIPQLIQYEYKCVDQGVESIYETLAVYLWRKGWGDLFPLHFSTLQNLSIAAPDRRDEDLEPFVRQMPRLKTLSLMHGKSRELESLYAVLPHLTRLEMVDLSSRNIEREYDSSQLPDNVETLFDCLPVSVVDLHLDLGQEGVRYFMNNAWYLERFLDRPNSHVTLTYPGEHLFHFADQNLQAAIRGGERLKKKGSIRGRPSQNVPLEGIMELTAFEEQASQIGPIIRAVAFREKGAEYLLRNLLFTSNALLAEQPGVVRSFMETLMGAVNQFPEAKSLFLSILEGESESGNYPNLSALPIVLRYLPHPEKVGSLRLVECSSEDLVEILEQLPGLTNDVFISQNMWQRLEEHLKTKPEDWRRVQLGLDARPELLKPRIDRRFFFNPSMPAEAVSYLSGIYESFIWSSLEEDDLPPFSISSFAQRLDCILSRLSKVEKACIVKIPKDYPPETVEHLRRAAEGTKVSFEISGR